MEEKIVNELSQFQNIYKMAVEFLVNYSFQVVGAILILIIGMFVAKKISNSIVSLLTKRGVDITLRTYTGYVINLLILFIFVVIALGKFGITIAPFVAALGALTVVAGLALQGLVANYAAGISIIATRPFKVGDTITVINVSGVVREIKLSMTLVETEDQEEIMIPNKHIIGEVLLNTFENRLVETTIGIAYDNDPEHAIHKLKEALLRLDFISKEPAPQVGINKFADSAIEIGVRAWVPTNSYMECRYLINKCVFDAIQQAGLTIPFPQLDVHQK
jgi:small conductance mechanosensitive channel